MPDWEWNLWAFGSQARIQSTEPQQPGPKTFLLKIFREYLISVSSGIYLGLVEFLNNEFSIIMLESVGQTVGALGAELRRELSDVDN